MSMPSARNKPKKIRATLPEPEVLPTTLDPGGEVVVSPSSNSLLGELYKTEAFAKAWTNDVLFHVSRNIFHLRRCRGMSQSKLAQLVGTSQSAIARMENGHENITLDTLQRLVDAMDGRFSVSLAPQELVAPYSKPWWELSSSGSWAVCGAIYHQGTEWDRALVGLERKREAESVPQVIPQNAVTSQTLLRL